jgi:hypothetical protein
VAAEDHYATLYEVGEPDAARSPCHPTNR